MIHPIPAPYLGLSRLAAIGHDDAGPAGWALARASGLATTDDQQPRRLTARTPPRPFLAGIAWWVKKDAVQAGVTQPWKSSSTVVTLSLPLYILPRNGKAISSLSSIAYRPGLACVPLAPRWAESSAASLGTAIIVSPYWTIASPTEYPDTLRSAHRKVTCTATFHITYCRVHFNTELATNPNN